MPKTESGGGGLVLAAGGRQVVRAGAEAAEAAEAFDTGSSAAAWAAAQAAVDDVDQAADPLAGLVDNDAAERVNAARAPEQGGARAEQSNRFRREDVERQETDDAAADRIMKNLAAMTPARPDW